MFRKLKPNKWNKRNCKELQVFKKYKKLPCPTVARNLIKKLSQWT